MASQKLFFHQGIILNPVSDTRCDFWREGVLVVEGVAPKARVKEILELDKARKKYAAEMKSRNTIVHEKCVIIPGFFDMHFHWVQDEVREMPKDSLLEWLEKYTFPTEMKFASKLYASKRARAFFKKLSAAGTLGGACYSSIHEHALTAAMDHVKGDFVIGNVLMDMNSPGSLSQQGPEALELTGRMIRKYKHRYVFTPRFAIATSPEVMKQGSAMADKAGCFKQTHLSENPSEISFVLELYRKMPGFENVKSYTDIYQRSGMLGAKSLMGHGIHLSEDELMTLSKTRTTIVHCPTSNAPLKAKGLGSGLFDFRQVEKARVRWALGSDIGGGPHLSMLDVMGSFVEQNRKNNISEATYTKALYRATLAGAEIMGMQKTKGNLAKGKEANFVMLRLNSRSVPKNPEEVLKSLVAPLRKSRHKYDELVRFVSYQGATLFRQK